MVVSMLAPLFLIGLFWKKLARRRRRRHA